MRNAILLVLLFSIPVSASFDYGFPPLERIKVFCEDRSTFLAAISHLEGFGLSNIGFDYYAGYLNESMVLAHFGIAEDEYTLKIARDLINIYQDIQSTINYFYIARGALSAYDMSDSTCVGEKSIYVNQFQEAYDLAIDRLEDMRENIRSLYYDSVSMLTADYNEADRLGYDEGLLEDWVWEKLVNFRNSYPDDITRAAGKIQDLLSHFDTNTLSEFNNILGWSLSIYLLPILRLHSEFIKSRERVFLDLKQNLESLNTLRSEISLEYNGILELPREVKMHMDSDEIERMLWSYHLAGYMAGKSRFYYEPYLEVTLGEDGLVIANSLVLNALERLNLDYGAFLDYKNGLEGANANLSEFLNTSIPSFNNSLSGDSTGEVIARRYLYDASRDIALSELYNDIYSRNYYLMHANHSLSLIMRAMANPALVVSLENEALSELIANLSVYLDLEDLRNRTKDLKYLPTELGDLYRRKIQQDLRFRLFGDPILNFGADGSEVIGIYRGISEFVNSIPEIPEGYQDLWELSLFFEDNFPLREPTLSNMNSLKTLESNIYQYTSKFSLLTSSICNREDYLFHLYPLSKVSSFESGSIMTSLSFTPLGELCLHARNQLFFELPSDDFYIFSNQSLAITDSTIMFENPAEPDIILRGVFSDYSPDGRASRIVGESLWVTENYTMNSLFNLENFLVKFNLDYCPEEAYAVYGEKYFPLSIYCNAGEYVQGFIGDVPAGASPLSLYYKLDPFDVSYSWNYTLTNGNVTGAVTVQLTNLTEMPIHGAFDIPLPYDDFIDYTGSTFTTRLESLIPYANMLVNYYQLEIFAHGNSVGRKIGKLISWSKVDYLGKSLQNTVNSAKNLMQAAMALNSTDETVPEYIFWTYIEVARAYERMKSDTMYLDSFLAEKDLYFINLNAAYRVYSLVGPNNINRAIKKYEYALNSLQEYDFYSALQNVREANSIFAETGKDIEWELENVNSGILSEINRLGSLPFLDFGPYKKEFLDRIKPSPFVYAIADEYLSLSELSERLRELSSWAGTYAEVFGDSCSMNYSSLRDTINLKLLDISERVNEYRESLKTDFSPDEKALLHVPRTANSSDIISEFESLMDEFQTMPGSIDGLSLEGKFRLYEELQNLQENIFYFDKEFSRMKGLYDAEIGTSLYLMSEFLKIARGSPSIELSRKLVNLNNAALDAHSEGYGAKAYLFSTEIFDYTRDLYDSIYSRARIEFILFFTIALVILFFVGRAYRNRFLRSSSSTSRRK